MPNRLDELLAGARNQSSSCDKVGAALARLKPDDAARVAAAIGQRRAGTNSRQWEYVADKLAAVICELAGVDNVTESAVVAYRRKLP